jgi:hypothetical protein
VKPGIFLIVREWRGVRRRAADDTVSAATKGAQSAASPNATATLLQKYGRGAIATLLLALVGPFVLLSESRLKDTIDTVFNGCLFVVDVRDAHDSDRVEVHAHLSGKTPEYLNLTFRARQGLINRLRFANGILVESPNEFSSLVLHPLAGQVCPGGLCETPLRISKPTEQMTIRLPYPAANFDYVFTAQLSEPVNATDTSKRLFVYSLADGSRAETCRVEMPNLFNWLVRLGRMQRFLAYCAMLLAATALVMLFKKWGEK